MRYDLARQALATAIGATAAGFTVVPENHKFDAPPGVTWIRWSLRPVTAKMADIGAKMERNDGLIWFQIFVPEGGGTVDAMKISDALGALFFEKYLTVDGSTTMRCHAGKLNFVGPDPTGWQIWRLIVDYQLDVFP